MVRAHNKVCRACQELTPQANRYCPEGWEMAKQLASVRSDIRRLSAAAAVVADTLF